MYHCVVLEESKSLPLASSPIWHSQMSASSSQVHELPGPGMIGTGSACAMEIDVPQPELYETTDHLPDGVAEIDLTVTETAEPALPQPPDDILVTDDSPPSQSAPAVEP